MHGLRSSNTITHDFISEPVAKQLGLQIQQQKGFSVSVANGAKIASVGLHAATPFTIEGDSFKVDLLVIPLAGFDLVLGVKWLKLLGPILWDFQARTMTFTAQQCQITLQAFVDLFNDPTGLPPVRHCDHRINLKLGTDPIVVRPYRYPHIQKDEIERHCLNMLAQGIIQPSRSPFSSHVLLVRKKDKSWRFCVD
ncbi:uncharacterized protein [Aristolochia californica]|uniref:uncharacterized protein n=1 Tax=Aristolochia californica TaxID=171875 RepID=UPI0035E1E5F7